MRTVARRVRVLLVSLLAGSAGLAAQVAVNNPQMPGDAIKGTGLMMGQVVDGSSGRPIAGATVVLSGGSGSSVTSLSTGELISTSSPASLAAAANAAPRQILTNAEGRFLFRELTRGRYTLRITASGYLPGGVGQTRPAGPMQAVELERDDEKKGDVVARLWKTGTISGTIVDETGEPIVGLNVRLLRRTMIGGLPRIAPAPVTTGSATDDRGMYRASGLQPGDYLVAVWTSQSSMPIATADAMLQLSASGVSATTSDLYRNLSNSGAPSPYMTGYRVGDLVLQPGGGRGGNSAPAVPFDEAKFMTYPTQYYPASSTSAHATVIALGSGEERGGVDMQLKLVQTVKISGTLSGPDGPAPNLGVRLVSVEAETLSTEAGAETSLTATDAAGNFTLLGVTPGNYTLKVLLVPRPAPVTSSTMTTIEVGDGTRMMGFGTSLGATGAPPPPLPPDPTLWASVPISVADADISGLAVSLKPGIRINGRIEFDGTKEKPAPDQIQRASLSFSPISGGISAQILLAPKRVERDGHFSSVGYPPGVYYVSASLPTAAPAAGPSGWTFRNATIGGRDVSNEGLELTGNDIADLVITFTDQATEVTGQVLDGKGLPDKDALVVVFPADSDGWKRGVLNTRRMRSIRASTSGAFVFSSLPPGAYYLAALPDDTTPSEWQDPKLLDRVAGVATRITLADGEKRTQSLTTRILR